MFGTIQKLCEFTIWVLHSGVYYKLISQPVQLCFLLIVIWQCFSVRSNNYHIIFMILCPSTAEGHQSYKLVDHHINRSNMDI